MERVIFFDLDATLYSYKEGHKAGLSASFLYWKIITGEEDFEDFKHRYLLSRQNVKRFLGGSVASHSRALYFQGMVETYFDTSLPIHTAELTQRYWDTFIVSIQPFPNTRDTLLKFKKQGFGLGIITNMSAEIQHRKLHQLGLDDLFDVIVTSEEAGQQKPHPHIYLHALNRFTPSLIADNCVMIGDNWEHDVEAAAYIGMTGILATMDLEEIPEKDSLRVDRFEDLYEVIQTIFAEPLDGVIKYKLNHENCSLRLIHDTMKDLIQLRDKLHELNLIGVYPPDYYMTPNVGFGNASVRYTTDGQFLVSGSQTGNIELTMPEHYSLVTHYVIEKNFLISKGPLKPSSESLTHAAVYEIAQEVKCVIHVHSKELWDAYQQLKMPTTPDSVLYGTPEMARAIQEVYKVNPKLTRPVAMRGHIEGLLTWGETLEEALQIYLDALKELNTFSEDE